MAFQITWETRPNTFGVDDRVAVLADTDNRLEVWPALGLNAYRWSVAGNELLYLNPQFFKENRPTRGGFPILFPFPNRIRAGTFNWDGKTYQLPIGDPAKKNAIHGFVFNRAWRVVDQGANNGGAWITGEFQGSIDAPKTLPLWPADYRLRVEYRLFDHYLQVDATVSNPDVKPLPFGLGFHPYFAIAPFGGPQALISVAANKYWELRDNLPTGAVVPVDATRDLRQGRRYESLQLDDVLTDLGSFKDVDPCDPVYLFASVRHPAGKPELTLRAHAADFANLVAFTPPHREAICLEPYTCTTDAINLQHGSGVDVLPPGESWRCSFCLHWS